jgi:hypothetical protein
MVWRVPAAAVAVVVALTLTITAATYPGWLVALSQDALRAAGLSSNATVTALTGSAELAGLKVEVSGGYADELSTVVFASFTPACEGTSCSSGFGGAGPYLTDQYGERYAITGGEGIGVGAYPMFFQPLAGQALRSGATLTLHVPVWTEPLGRGVREIDVRLSGTLKAASASKLANPAPVVDAKNSVTYEVTGLYASANYLEVHTRLSGQLGNVIVKIGGGGMTGEAWPGVFLVDSKGSWQIPLAGGAVKPTVSQSVQDETRIFSVRPGEYRIVVATSAQQNIAPGPRWTVLAGWPVTVGR